MAKPSSNRARKPATATHPKAASHDRRRPDPRAQRKPGPVSDASESWPIRFCCYVCMRDGRRERATLRIFSGNPQGAGASGGWPACDTHHPSALADAFRPLTEGRAIAPQWEVTAFRVHDLDGEPSMDHAPLWVASTDAQLAAAEAEVRRLQHALDAARAAAPVEIPYTSDRVSKR